MKDAGSSTKVLPLRGSVQQTPTTPPHTARDSEIESTPTPPSDKKRRHTSQKSALLTEDERSPTSPSPGPETQPNGHLLNGSQKEEPERENAPPTPASSGSSWLSMKATSYPAPPSPNEAAPIAKVDGVPVIQEAKTAIPDEQERAYGVKPPPPPDPTPAKTEVPEKEKTADVSTKEEEEEIPDSQPSPKQKPPSPAPVRATLGEARLPAIPDQLQQLPLQPPLVISTDCNNRIKTKPPQNPLPTELGDVTQQETSSPVSSVDGDNRSTPGPGILSSATSPDANHISVPSDETGLQAEAAFERTVWKQAKAQQNSPQPLEKTDGEDLPSTVAEKEIAREAEDVAMEMPVIPSSQESSEPLVTSTKEPKPNAREKSVEKQLASPASPAVEPISPDPSAQLQLEHELAKSVTPIPVPDDISRLSDEKAVEAEDAKAREEDKMPAPQQKQEQVLDDMEYDDEDEDRVQLVGSTEPASRIPSPQTAGALPRSPVEPPIIQEPPTITVEKDGKAESAEDTKVPEVLAPQHPADESTPTPKPTTTIDAEKVQDQNVPDAASELPTSAPQKEPTSTTRDEVAGVRPPTPSIVLPVDDTTNPEDVEMEDGGAVSKAVEPPREEPKAALAPTPVGEHAEAGRTSVPQTANSVDVPAQPSPKPTIVEIDRDATESMELDDAELQPTPAQPAEKPTTLAPLPGIETVPNAPASSLSPAIIDSTSAAERAAQSSTDEDSDMATTAVTTAPEASSEESKHDLHLPRKHSVAPPKLSLSKIVVSSARHAASSAEAELKRLREDQEQQGLIVVARRRTQQAATVAARGRSSLFPPGSKMDALTRFQVDDPPLTADEAAKKVDVFESFYSIKSLPSSADDLIKRAPKAVTTDYHNVRLFDSQTIRILQRVSELQDQGMWSLRQPAKAPEPPRKKVHWDYMLDEMKWIQQDFRGERRWKIGVAKQVVDWVMEWHHTDPEYRLLQGLIVDRKTVGYVPKGIRTAAQPKQNTADEDIDMADMSHPTPELVAGGNTPEDEGGESYFVKQEQEDEVMVTVGEEGELYKHLEGPPTATVFALRPQEAVFSIVPSKAAQDVLDQLPLFGAPSAPRTDRPETVESPVVIPTSKYTVARIETDCVEPPRKKSRYEYEINRNPYADDSDDEDVLDYDQKDRSMRPIPLQPEQNNVALFRPEFKNTLNRVRNHIFRPPSDMPPASFFEHRTPSLWTAEEDEKLRQLAKEYNHNWGLISTFMVLDGQWHSGAERRSPWECFERWLGFGDFPQEFTKSPYYKPVQQRLELAGKYSQQYVAAHQNSQNVPTLKRKGTIPMRVERRRQTKQFTLFDAMRKLAKKRETSMTKSQQGNRGMFTRRSYQSK